MWRGYERTCFTVFAPLIDWTGLWADFPSGQRTHVPRAANFVLLANYLQLLIRVIHDFKMLVSERLLLLNFDKILLHWSDVFEILVFFILV